MTDARMTDIGGARRRVFHTERPAIRIFKMNFDQYDQYIIKNLASLPKKVWPLTLASLRYSMSHLIRMTLFGVGWASKALICYHMKAPDRLPGHSGSVL